MDKNGIRLNKNLQGCLAAITDSEQVLSEKVDLINAKIDSRSEVKEHCREIDDEVTKFSEESRTKIEVLLKDLNKVIM